MTDLDELLAAADPAARQVDAEGTSDSARERVYQRVIACRLDSAAVLGLPKSTSIRKWWPRRMLAVAFSLIVALAGAVAAVALTRSRPLASPAQRTVHLAPLADVSATPAGWEPLPFYGVQVSVPNSWFIETPQEGSCAGGRADGLVFLNEPAATLINPGGCGPTIATVSLVPATRAPVPHGRTAVVHDIKVIRGWKSSAKGITYLERALGVDISARGRMAREVLATLTHSPLSVVLNSRLDVTPAGWQQLGFGGIRFAAPSGWAVEHETKIGGCGPGVLSDGVLLDTARSVAPPEKCRVVIGYEQATNGLRVDAGPAAVTELQRGSSCRQQNGVRICMNRQSVLDREFSELSAAVYVPGRTQPDIITLGLGGSGLTALEVFDSIRA